jgi:hypothetical protein
MQKVLILTTYAADLRSKVDGITCEDGDSVQEYFTPERREKYGNVNDMPVGLIGSVVRYGTILYRTPLHALGDGWKLLAPPQEYDSGLSDPKYAKGFEWWFVKDRY